MAPLCTKINAEARETNTPPMKPIKAHMNTEPKVPELAGTPCTPP